MAERAAKNPKIQILFNTEIDEVLGDEKGVFVSFSFSHVK